MISVQISEHDVIKQFREIVQNIESGGGQSWLDALEALRRKFPDNNQIALYCCSIALHSKQYTSVIAYSRVMMPKSDSPITKVRWAFTLGTAQLLATDIQDAVESFSSGLELLISLAKIGQLPKPQNDKKSSLSLQGVSVAESLLWRTLHGLKAEGMQVFPMFGTLLGLIREGGLLPFDKDLDVGVWLEDFKSACIYLQGNGMIPSPLVPSYDNFAAFIDKETRLTFDVCGFRREPERQQIVGGFWLYKKPRDYQRITLFPWFDVVERKISEEQHCWWPTNPEQILQTIYGDWKTPKKEWDSVVSALNIQSGSLLHQCYAYSRLGKYWLQGDIARAKRYIEEINVSIPADPLIGKCRRSLNQVLAKRSKHAS